MIHPTRRSFIGSMIALVAAPAIVRVGSIMPVKVMEPVYGTTIPTNFKVEHWVKEIEPELDRIVRELCIPQEIVQLYRQNPLLSLLLGRAYESSPYTEATA